MSNYCDSGLRAYHHICYPTSAGKYYRSETLWNVRSDLDSHAPVIFAEVWARGRSTHMSRQYADLCFLGKPEKAALATCWWPAQFASHYQKGQVSKVLSCWFQYKDSWRPDNIGEYNYFRRTDVILTQAFYNKLLSLSVICSSASTSIEWEHDTSWSRLTILCTWETSPV